MVAARIGRGAAGNGRGRGVGRGMFMRIGVDGRKIPEAAKRGPLGSLDHARSFGMAGLFYRTVLDMSPRLDRGELRAIRQRADELGMYVETGLGKVNPYASPEAPELRQVGDGDIVLGFRRMMEACVDIGCRELWIATANYKTIYAGRWAYDRFRTDVTWAEQLEATQKFLLRLAPIARDLGTPLLIHQPSYSMLNRWIEAPDGGQSLLDELEEQGMGCIVFSPLAQGLLTDRYLGGVPQDSRAARQNSSLPGDHLDEATLGHVRRLDEIARSRGQKLAQLALQWAVRDPRVTSALIGASSVEQLDTNLDALSFPDLTAEELAAIDANAVEAGINLWARSSAD